MVRKYYSPALKAWLGDLEDGKHDGGPEDPRIGVIKVVAKTATYAIAEGTIFGRGGEIAKGVVTGSAPKVNKLREINEQELEQCKLLLPTQTHFVPEVNMKDLRGRVTGLGWRLILGMVLRLSYANKSISIH